MKYLLIIVAILLAVYGVMQLADKTMPKSTQTSEPFFPQLKEKLADIDSIEVKKAGQEPFSIKLQNDQWVVPAVSNYPADVNKVRQLLLAMAQLQPVLKMTAMPDNYQKLALQDIDKANSQAILLKLNDAFPLLVGKRAYLEQQPQQYVRRPNEKQTWLAEPALEVPAQPIEWVNREIINVREQGVKSIQILKDGDEKLYAYRDSKDSGFTLKSMPNVDASKLTAHLGGVLEYFQFTDVKPATAINSKPMSLIIVDTFDDIKIDVALHPYQNRTWVVLSARHYGQNPQNAQFTELINQRQQWAYALPDDRLSMLAAKPADFKK